MSIKSLIKRNRERIDKELSRTEKWQYFSPAILAQFRVTLPLVQKYVHGKCLDIGCGEMPYEAYILPHVTEYDGLDSVPRSPRVRYTADAQHMPGVPSISYDSAVCLEVLEHLPQPQLALQEIFRVLKPGGVLVASVPHISRLHDVPHDYYRYTRYGIQFLLRQAGFNDISIQPKGGIFSFLGHQVSTILVVPVWHIPVLRDLAFFLNAWLVTRLCYWLDQVTDRDSILALGYAFVAQKPETHATAEQ